MRTEDDFILLVFLFILFGWYVLPEMNIIIQNQYEQTKLLQQIASNTRDIEYPDLIIPTNLKEGNLK